MDKSSYEPKIVGFVCRWCTYAGADLAGINRLEYPANMKLIRVMCSGRVDPNFILYALAEGADGVLISGCHPGECHYVTGNMNATRRYQMLCRVLAQYGIEKERVHLTYISAAEGEKFARVAKELTDKLRELGPLNWHDNWRID